MNVTKFCALFTLMHLYFIAMAQDTIALKSGQKIIGQVNQVTDASVAYSKNIGGTRVDMKVSSMNITQISFANGNIDRFDPNTGLLDVANSIVNKPKPQSATVPLRKVTMVDSFKINFVNTTFNYFDLIKLRSPVVPFEEGIFMVNEKIWFYNVPKNTKLYSFAMCHEDTSLYLFYDINNGIYLKNYKIDPLTGKQIVTDLVSLDKKHQYKIFPLGSLNYYILAKDSVSDVYYSTKTSQKRLLRTKKNITNIIPLDAQNFVACYVDELILYSIKDVTMTPLFHSPLPIISSVLLSSGAPVIATGAGIFIINKDLTANKLNIPVTDGVLKLYNNYLYVLSNKRGAIYRVKI